MHEKAVFLALHGFVATVLGGSRDCRIKRCKVRGEVQLQWISTSARWVRGGGSWITSYAVIPWDEVPIKQWEVLPWEMIMRFVEEA